MKIFVIVSVIFSVLLFQNCYAANKYSAEANKPSYDPLAASTLLRELEKPFRMAKLNLLWTKAKHRLPDSKLQSLFSDLKIHDKEEIAFKHYRTDNKDTDGLLEAKLRKKLIGIMSTYGLLEHFKETENSTLLHKHKPLNDGSNYIPKNIFKDTKLNKLWAKAEMAGFTNDELEALKEEFQHHQDKVDEYMSILKDVDNGENENQENSIVDKLDSWNEIEHKEEEEVNTPKKQADFLSKANLLREKHMELRNGYDHLDTLTAKGPNHKEFTEPKVLQLWKAALDSNFPKEQLASLKEELRHYESRLIKLKRLHAEEALEAARKGKNYEPNDATMKQHIKKQARTVQKLHLEIESKIAKHLEL